MLAYSPTQTFLMLASGKPVVVNRPLREVVNKFARDVDIRELDVDYHFRDYHKRPKALVSGELALVPSCGCQNSEVVFYMSHFLVDTEYNSDRGEMTLSFQREMFGELYTLALKVAKQSFLDILQSAKAVGDKQHQIKQGQRSRSGELVGETAAEQARYLEAFTDYELVRMTKVLQSGLCDMAQIEFTEDECQRYVRRQLTAPYRI